MALRIILYFIGTFAASLAAGISEDLSNAALTRLIACSLGAGCAAVVAYLDRSSANRP